MKKEGFLASGNHFFELGIGDFVTMRNDEDTFWLGKVCKIHLGNNAADVMYNIWYFVPKANNADVWDFKTK